MKMKLAFLILAAVATISGSPGQDAKTEKGPPPGNVRLLPGYDYTVDPTYDARWGKIFKKDGVEISWSDGFVEKQFAELEKSATFEWKVSQTIGGVQYQIGRSKEDLVVVTATGDGVYANFSAKVKSVDEMAEMMLIVLSCRPAETTRARERK